MLDKEKVQYIATLARIGLNKNEIPKYQKDLSAILNYFEKLKKLDTEKIESIGHITGRFNSEREDEVQNFGNLGREAILKNVPEKKNGFIKVKSVL